MARKRRQRDYASEYRRRLARFPPELSRLARGHKYRNERTGLEKLRDAFRNGRFNLRDAISKARLFELLYAIKPDADRADIHFVLY